MSSTLSPHHDAGGTLHCPSPTSISSVDVLHAKIRRSLSRSPSKTSFNPRSHSPQTWAVPPTPSPLSPTRHGSVANNSTVISFTQDIRPGARVNRPTMRRNPQISNSGRSRTSPKSPMKRALSNSSDNGNSRTPSTPTVVNNEFSVLKPFHGILPEQENNSHPQLWPAHNADSSVTKRSISRLEKRRSTGFSDFTSLSSPLKRSDGIMNLDQASQGSPAKRRSLHGATFSSDFNIFDHESASAPASQESNADFDVEETPNRPPTVMAPPASPFVSAIPKRSSSLRKSTVQQRQSDRSPLLTRSRPDPAGESQTSNNQGLKARQRLSLDNNLLVHTRESPFSTPTFLPNASIHPIPQPQFTTGNGQQNAHPLSQTLTQSSSSSSIVDESPTHEPIHRPDAPRKLDFSKSLPVGALRPTLLQENSKQSSDGSFSTPESYRFAKPNPAAFMSTGLISKKVRNVDDYQNPHRSGKMIMPDTPCKKQPMTSFISTREPRPDSTGSKPKRNRHSLGAPSTPFGTEEGGSNVYSKGVSIFGNTFKKPEPARRASFASIEGDDRPSQSPLVVNRQQSLSGTDFNFPPTPTRPGISHGHGHNQLGDSPSRDSVSPQPMSQPQLTEPYSVAKGPSSKFNLIETLPGSTDGHSDSAMGDSPQRGHSPSANLRLKSSQTSASIPSSFTRSRTLRNLNSPTPLSKKSLAAPSLLISPVATHAKSGCWSPASPLGDRFERNSPHTPQESILPPDPSGLSISAHSGRLMSRSYMEAGSSSASGPVPATPTGPKEDSTQFGKRKGSGVHGVEVDPVLTGRFERVEPVGVGEFSQVFRVTQPAQMSPLQRFYPRSRSPDSLPKCVWAVKKSRHPYAGMRDRQHKLREVNVLKGLGHSDHIISFVDSWEENNHLYIQTEFCEDGGLDVFLDDLGRKGRMDDFRIWKILLELSLGLKHIHDAGYIHLDIKPANVLVTFEGVLKIADFGMATKWPAPPGIEREGDREYMGPEILRGQYDKPADIFSLGLIIFETAGNVWLPENGYPWQKLRMGDTSDVPSLSWSSEGGDSVTFRDSTGNPISPEPTFERVYGSDSEEDIATNNRSSTGLQSRAKYPLGHRPIPPSRHGELADPPLFMIDPFHEDAVDGLVRWMLSPDPSDRPTTDQILQATGVLFAERRRRAGATIYEGNWGPSDDMFEEDTEMTDV